MPSSLLFLPVCNPVSYILTSICMSAHTCIHAAEIPLIASVVAVAHEFCIASFSNHPLTRTTYHFTLHVCRTTVFALGHTRIFFFLQEMLVEPVIAADGHTYERSALQNWLQDHNTSPVTGASLLHMRMVPNLVIRSAVASQRQFLTASHTASS